MKKYIPLDALVAEINRVVDSYDPTNEITSGRYALVRLRNFINTLEVKEVDENFELPKKYETDDWLWKYHYIDLTYEHIKRLNNAINILKSPVNEHTDAKYLKEIKDKLLEVMEVKEVDLEKEMNKEWDKCEPSDEGMGLEIASIEHEQFDNIVKHFFELGLRAQKKE